MDLEKIRHAFESVASNNQWQHLHSPKNLSMALTVEVGELLEHFQWLDEQQARNIKKDSVKQAEVAGEIADVFMYLLILSDKLDIDLESAVEDKLNKLKKRFGMD
ncbi:MAG: nucleotide pyrophosphohydrolase [Pseudomonadales bacterium]|nr:nucleotide pyrophosphohydrolase [Pseudomonadales bacterium]